MKTRFQLVMISMLLGLMFANVGCASFGRKFKDFINGKSSEEVATKSVAGSGRIMKYSENDNVGVLNKRRYQRTTRKTLEEDSQFDSRAGSLWVMEGQGSYLFAQNIMRLVGDPVSVLIEGDPREQLESKANVIKKLLAKLEKKSQAAVRNPAGASGQEKGQSTANPTGQQPDQQNPQNPAAQGDDSEKSEASETENFAFNVKAVPTRITERMTDGNYRVKGSQTFMIGKREYRVIVTGIVRSDDFDESGVSASKLMDPSFDIVSNRKVNQGQIQ